MSDSPEPDKKSREPKPFGEDEQFTEPTKDDDEFDDLGGNTGFDYSAFEESLSDLDSEEQDVETDPGVTSEVMHTRLTLDTMHVPKDDATSHLRELGQYTVVSIRGRINEAFGGASLGAKLRGKVVFDLTEVDRITSFGVRAWLQMLDAARLKDAVFFRASPAVVNQITMMRNFCGPARIHSLIAPYSCASCGSEFGVPYDAIEDRAMLRARNPLKVACPQCQASAEMDEDPWVFFAVDEQLLDEVTPDLERVLGNLGDVPQHNPIEKTMQDDGTRIRFNGPVTGETRFQRAFAGLEGPVVVDLRTATSVAPAGTEGLVMQLARLTDEVTRLDLEGAPLELVEHVLNNPDLRVQVRSVATMVRSLARPLERRIIVDLKRERAALKAGLPLDVDVPWRDDPLEVEGMPLLQRAAAAFDLGAPTPAPAAVPAAPTGQVVLGSAQTPPAHASNRSVLPYVAAGMMGMLALVSVAAIVFAFTNRNPVQAPPPIADPVVVAPTTDGQWSSGGAVPPAWSEVPAKSDGDKWVLVGHGDAESMANAMQNARADATASLLESIRPRVPQHFEDEKLPQAGPERTAALTAFELAIGSLTFERTNLATFQDGSDHEVVAQYSLSAAALDGLLAGYGSVEDFRGMKIAQSAPWANPGLRLLSRESFVRNARAGDRLKTLDGAAVRTIEQFRTSSQASYAKLVPGSGFDMVFDRKGVAVTTTIIKRGGGGATAPRPVAPEPARPTNRPTLFTKDR